MPRTDVLNFDRDPCHLFGYRHGKKRSTPPVKSERTKVLNVKSFPCADVEQQTGIVVGKFAFATNDGEFAFDGAEGVPTLVTDVAVGDEENEQDSIVLGSLILSESIKPNGALEQFSAGNASLLDEGSNAAIGVQWGRWFGDWDYFVDGFDINNFRKEFPLRRFDQRRRAVTHHGHGLVRHLGRRDDRQRFTMDPTASSRSAPSPALALGRLRIQHRVIQFRRLVPPSHST